MIRRATILFVVGLALITGSWLVPSTVAAHGDCDVEALTESIAGYEETLHQLSDLTEQVTDEALAEALWNLGQSIQQAAVDCGFEPPMHMDDMDMDHGDGDDHEDTGAAHEMGEVPDEETIMHFAMELGDPEHGEELFNTVTETGFACATCHRVDSRETLVGPGLRGVAFMMHVHGDPEDMHMMTPPFEVEHDILPEGTLAYLYTSIMDPSAVVVEGFPDNVMPKTFSEIFSQDDIADIIAYLSTLTPSEEMMESMDMGHMDDMGSGDNHDDGDDHDDNGDDGD